MNLFAWPPASSTIGTMSPKNSFKSATASRALAFSANAVKSRMSTKIIVASTCSPSSSSPSAQHALGDVGIDVAAERLHQGLALLRGREASR